MVGRRVYTPSTGIFGVTVKEGTIFGIPDSVIVLTDNGKRICYIGNNEDLVFVDTGLTRSGASGVTIPDQS